jgi:hypothetical protein
MDDAKSSASAGGSASYHTIHADEADYWQKMPDDLNTCLVLKESKEESGIFGIGLKIDTARIPYIVKEGSKIFDDQGKSINDSVNVGDTIASLDGYPMEKVSGPVLLLTNARTLSSL